MNKKQIELPKGYLSFSQVSLWEASPERYKKLYFDNDQSYNLSNPGLTYGKIVADALEHQKNTGDLLTDTAMELLPKYDVRDKEIYTTIHTKHGDINVLGRPDFLESSTKNFIEIKTGKVKWTQKKADNHLQLKFYQMLIYLKFGKVIKKADLTWMETYKDEETGETKPTGHIETFIVKLGLNNILNTLALTSRVAKEIELEYSVYIPLLEEPF